MKEVKNVINLVSPPSLDPRESSGSSYYLYDWMKFFIRWFFCLILVFYVYSLLNHLTTSLPSLSETRTYPTEGVPAPLVKFQWPFPFNIDTCLVFYNNGLNDTCNNHIYPGSEGDTVWNFYPINETTLPIPNFTASNSDSNINTLTFVVITSADPNITTGFPLVVTLFDQDQNDETTNTFILDAYTFGYGQISTISFARYINETLTPGSIRNMIGIPPVQRDTNYYIMSSLTGTQNLPVQNAIGVRIALLTGEVDILTESPATNFLQIYSQFGGAAAAAYWIYTQILGACLNDKKKEACKKIDNYLASHDVLSDNAAKNSWLCFPFYPFKPCIECSPGLCGLPTWTVRPEDPHWNLWKRQKALEEFLVTFIRDEEDMKQFRKKVMSNTVKQTEDKVKEVFKSPEKVEILVDVWSLIEPIEEMVRRYIYNWNKKELQEKTQDWEQIDCWKKLDNSEYFEQKMKKLKDFQEDFEKGLINFVTDKFFRKFLVEDFKSNQMSSSVGKVINYTKVVAELFKAKETNQAVEAIEAVKTAIEFVENANNVDHLTQANDTEIQASGSTTGNDVEKKKNFDVLTQAMDNAIQAVAKSIKLKTGNDVENTTKEAFEAAISQLPTEKEKQIDDKYHIKEIEKIEEMVYEVFLEIVRAAIKRAVEETKDKNELNQLEQRQQLLKRILKVFIIDFLYLKHKDGKPFWKKLLGGWFWSSE